MGVHKTVVKSTTERALEYVSKASRIRLQDLKDNPGAKVKARQVGQAHNQTGQLSILVPLSVTALVTRERILGHTIGELQHAAKPPLGWVWGNWYTPWQVDTLLPSIFISS